MPEEKLTAEEAAKVIHQQLSNQGYTAEEKIAVQRALGIQIRIELDSEVDRINKLRASF